MREIEKRMIKAIKSKKNFRCTNTDVQWSGDFCKVYLHDNLIATLEVGFLSVDQMKLTLCGWPTPTTRMRLNALCEGLLGERPFTQRKGVQYFREDPIESDDLIAVNTYQEKEHWKVA